MHALEKAGRKYTCYQINISLMFAEMAYPDHVMNSSCHSEINDMQLGQCRLHSGHSLDTAVLSSDSRVLNFDLVRAQPDSESGSQTGTGVDTAWHRGSVCDCASAFLNITCWESAMLALCLYQTCIRLVASGSSAPIL